MNQVAKRFCEHDHPFPIALREASGSGLPAYSKQLPTPALHSISHTEHSKPFFARPGHGLAAARGRPAFALPEMLDRAEVSPASC